MVSQLVTLNEYSELPVKEPDWLIPNLIPREGLILLIGPPKEGKSFLALQLARDAAQAKPILGHEIDKPIVSLYLQLDARPRVWRIVTRSLKECGEDLSGPVFFVHPDNCGRYNILLESDRNILRSYVEQSQAELIILDVLREVHQGLLILLGIVLHNFLKCYGHSLREYYIFHSYQDVQRIQGHLNLPHIPSTSELQCARL